MDAAKRFAHTSSPTPTTFSRATEVRARLAADLRGWETNNALSGPKFLQKLKNGPGPNLSRPDRCLLSSGARRLAGNHQMNEGAGSAALHVMA
jgi:hypothetical protein